MEPKVYYTIEGKQLSSYVGLEDLLIQDDVYDSFIELKKIKMVGSYMFTSGDLWYSFPKYYHLEIRDGKLSKQDQDNMKIIIQVIEKLRYSGKNLFEGDHIFAPDSMEEQKRKVNTIELSSFIVKDYMANGIYVREKKEYTKDGIGKIAWVRTINKGIPIISQNAIVYDKLWKKQKFEDSKNDISIIHSSIISKAIDIYERYHGYIGITKPEEIIELSDNDFEEYSKMLKQELLYIFNDNKIAIIKALIAWCEATYNYKMAGCTNCFPNVWEWVNNEVFGNQSKKESEYPEYKLKNEDGVLVPYKGRGTAKPDTIYFEKDEQNKRNYLYVYDSKYYLPKLSKEDIYDYPSNSDIVKQVAYMNGICDSLNRLEGSVIAKNVFLLPEITEEKSLSIDQDKQGEELFSELGYVVKANFDEMAATLINNTCIELFTKRTIDDESEKVYLYMVYCSKLYDMFLKNKKYVPKK